MTITNTPIAGLCIIKSAVIEDERGYFFESYNQQRFAEYGLPTSYAQDNESKSHKGVLRGLHFQKPPFAQGKLVRVIAGAVLDVAVDLRKNSATYGQHYSCVLSAENKLMFYIPDGFAHGFYTLENNTIFAYKCTQAYHKASEGGLLYSDPDLNIQWGNATDPKQVSERDAGLPLFGSFVTPFE
jgi:dTDP-4-dehydrorhamnose 3,5-epimerase